MPAIDQAEVRRVLEEFQQEIARLRAAREAEQAPLRRRLRETESEEERWQLGRDLQRIHAAYQWPIDQLLAASVRLFNMLPPAPVVLSKSQAEAFKLSLAL